MKISRIPDYTDYSFDGMLLWFSTMSERGLLFHPDDPAEEIYDTVGGHLTFTSAESGKANEILKTMFRQFGNEVYDAAYPVFMKCMDIQLDA